MVLSYRSPVWRFRSIFGLASWFGAAAVALAVALPAADEAEATRDVERGRYLVHHVAQCIQCHTPRTGRGVLLRRRLMQGATIPIDAPYRDMPWAFESPWLAGMANYENEMVVYLLQHGQRPDGSVPRRPMPTFQMTPADARAVVAYLASLQ